MILFLLMIFADNLFYRAFISETSNEKGIYVNFRTNYYIYEYIDIDNKKINSYKTDTFKISNFCVKNKFDLNPTGNFLYFVKEMINNDTKVIIIALFKDDTVKYIKHNDKFKYYNMLLGFENLECGYIYLEIDKLNYLKICIHFTLKKYLITLHNLIYRKTKKNEYSIPKYSHLRISQNIIKKNVMKKRFANSALNYAYPMPTLGLRKIINKNNFKIEEELETESTHEILIENLEKQSKNVLPNKRKFLQIDAKKTSEQPSIFNDKDEHLQALNSENKQEEILHNVKAREVRTKFDTNNKMLPTFVQNKKEQTQTFNSREQNPPVFNYTINQPSTSNVKIDQPSTFTQISYKEQNIPLLKHESKKRKLKEIEHSEHLEESRKIMKSQHQMNTLTLNNILNNLNEEEMSYEIMRRYQATDKKETNNYGVEDDFLNSIYENNG